MKQLFYKFIYFPPVNFSLRKFIRCMGGNKNLKFNLPPSGTLRIKLSSGKVLRLKTNQTSQLTRRLYWQGYQSFEYTPIFEKLIHKISVFYDIGANIGYYSLLAAVENKNVRVVGFEPAASPFYYFRQNIEINHLSNVKAEPIAIAESEGDITFYEIKNDKYAYMPHNLAGESNAGSKTKGRNYVKSIVPAITLDQYVTLHEKENIDLIKMDTEGTESLILTHSEKVLSQMKPIVICETLYDTIESELEAIFKRHGYLFYNHTPQGLQKTNTVIRSVDDGIRDCFFVPPEKVHLIEEFIAEPS